MTQTLYEVGYGRPPVNTRFRKGQSGNPGGKAGPEKLLKHQLEAALGNALNADEVVLRQGKPGKVIESFVRQLALDALDGKTAAQRLVLAIVEREAREGPAAAAEETASPPTDEAGARGASRQLLGERYDEFWNRYDAAVEAGSVDDMVALAEDFDVGAKFPASGNS